MSDKIKWYQDSKKWRKEHGFTSELMEDYDRMWCDRLIITACVFFMIAIKLGIMISM